MARVISLLLCFVLLASLALVDAGKKKQKGHSYPVPQKVIILQAGPSATYPWVGHCPPKGKCKHFYKIARPPFPSFLPPAPRLPYYAPVQYAPAPYSAPVYTPQAPLYSQPEPVYSQQPEPVYPQQSAPVYAQQPEPIYPQQSEPYAQQPEPVYPQQSEPVYPQQSEPVYPQQSEPVYAQQSEPVYSQPAPVYSQPAPVYSEQAEYVQSEPAPAYSQPGPVDSAPAQAPSEYSAAQSFSESVIPAYSQSETVPDLPKANFAIQEVSAPEFNYGSGSSDIGSSESQSYSEGSRVPTYSGPESYPVAEIETVPVEEAAYVPTEPTGYSGSSSGEIQQEIVQYVEQPALENAQQIDNYQQQDPELTEFFNDPIFQHDAYANIVPSEAPQPDVYQQEDASFQPTDQADNYGERIRPRGGRR
ncbi:LOW QUALITY PROTEIN: extensin-2 [Daphnia magna]|uniref:LOW QUALITY PROTEIN: extensin-2 n=1 Tax=Daphnia magna TaxID=35525 RepID=UPI001E1BCB62|nr:LOW QUALITY PROTEIN: extensin-2 [Daphnia magna]